MYNKLIRVNTRNAQILSFYAITLYTYDYYRNGWEHKITTVSDNKNMIIEKKWRNLK